MTGIRVLDLWGRNVSSWRLFLLLGVELNISRIQGSIFFLEAGQLFADLPNLFPKSTVQGMHSRFFVDRQIEEAPADH